MPSTKKSSAKKSTKKASVEHVVHHRHFRLSKNNRNFWNFEPSIQTVYWVLIGIGVVGTAVINFNTNLRVNELLNQIDSQNQVIETLQTTKSAAKAE